MIKKNQFFSTKALIFLIINLGTILVSFACNCSYPNPPPSHKHPTFPPKPPKSKPPFIPKPPKHHPPHHHHKTPHNPKPPIVKPPPHHVPKPPVYPKPPIIVHPPFIPNPPVVIHPPPPIIPKPPVYPPVYPNPPNPPVVPIPPTVKPPSPPTETPCPPPPPVAPKPQTCPIDSLKLGACVDLLGGLIHIGIGGSSAAKETCCPVLEGLVGLDAAVCLCTTIKAKLLNINIIIPIALGVLVDCGKHPPSDFQCPSS